MIGIIDYGLGNVAAFESVFRRIGAPTYVVKQGSDAEQATAFVLPGVGAFDQAMSMFNESGLRAPVERRVLGEAVPILGVCVGMQMLADGSEEGSARGLGWIRGYVRRIRPADGRRPVRLPHMGWNDVRVTGASPLLRGVQDGTRFYFLHSYRFEPRDTDAVLAEVDYGERFPCALAVGNVYGVQFHPEKSHEAGVRLLESFARIGRCCDRE